ncbi:BCL-2-associated athanogene 4 isoform X2 [Wolffia australiana]
MKEDGIDGSGTTIKIVISSGSHFREVAVNPRSTFGELKIVLAELFGLAPGEQRLLFRGKEKEDADFLHTAGVRDQSRVVLMASPVVQQEEISETTYHQVDSVVCEAVVGVRVEVDKLAEKVSRLALAIEGGNKVSEQEFLVLPELLMRQLLKLDCIEAEGEAKVQRRNEDFVSFQPAWAILVYDFKPLRGQQRSAAGAELGRHA